MDLQTLIAVQRVADGKHQETRSLKLEGIIDKMAKLMLMSHGLVTQQCLLLLVSHGLVSHAPCDPKLTKGAAESTLAHALFLLVAAKHAQHAVTDSQLAAQAASKKKREVDVSKWSRA